MIPVALQPEPADFDDEVRQRGHAWLRAQGIALDSAPPKASKLPTYWSRSNKHLWDAYSGDEFRGQYIEHWRQRTGLARVQPWQESHE